MSGWCAGAASAQFDIPIGTPMAGYMARAGGSTGTLDPLSVSALVMTAGDRTLTIIAADILGIDRELVGEIAQLAGIDPGWLAVCASHAHSGPAGVSKQARAEPDSAIDPELRHRFVEACAAVALQARAKLAGAVVTFGLARTNGISANRNSQAGPYDPTVRVLRISDRHFRPIATLVNFACHPTILPASSNLISADFPGAIRRALDPGMTGAVLFTNGAAGDVSTRFTRQSQDGAEVERVGRVVADAVQHAMAHASGLDPALDLREIDVELTPRDRAEIHRIITDARARLEGIDIDSLEPAERRIAETRVQGITILERVAADLSDQAATITIPLWTIGALSLFGIPGELFASLGELCTQGDDRRLILGYTNGYLGYFADRAAYDQGLYEALASPFAPGASEAMIGRLLGDQ